MDSKIIETIRKIIRKQPSTIEEINEFIVSYVEKTKGKPPTSEELASIIELMRQGVFSINYAAEQYAKLLNYQILKVIDLKTNTIKRIDFYEL